MSPATPTEPATAAVVARVSAEALRQRLRKSAQLKGRQPDDAARAQVRALIGDGPHPREQLIERLHRLNDSVGALREGHLVALAAEMRLPMAEVAEVASFYHHFQIVADEAALPRLTVRVCDSPSCALAGAAALHERLAAVLGPDVQLLHAPCVGRCEQAPVAVVGQCAVPHAEPGAVAARCAQGASAHPPVHPLPPDAARFDPAAAAPCAITDGSETDIAPACVGYRAYRAAGGYQLAAAVVNGEHDSEAVLAAMTDSGLRGLGGAGFPAGRKWAFVRGFAGPRCLAVNIDEGEPGTFKDRTYLERDPHRFLEGALVAAQVVGIDAVYIYLRDEYAGCRAILQQALQQLQVTFVALKDQVTAEGAPLEPGIAAND